MNSGVGAGGMSTGAAGNGPAGTGAANTERTSAENPDTAVRSVPTDARAPGAHTAVGWRVFAAASFTVLAWALRSW